MSKADLEERLAILERKFARFEKRLTTSIQSKDWRSTFGQFADDPGFDKIVRLGRKIRRQLNKDKSA